MIVSIPDLCTLTDFVSFVGKKPNYKAKTRAKEDAQKFVLLNRLEMLLRIRKLKNDFACNAVVLQDSNVYIFTINLPVTDLSTVFEVLNRSAIIMRP